MQARRNSPKSLLGIETCPVIEGIPDPNGRNSPKSLLGIETGAIVHSGGRIILCRNSPKSLLGIETARSRSF